MSIINSIQRKHKDLFVMLKAQEVHPHDHFMAATVLKLIPETVTPNQITALRVILTPLVFMIVLRGDLLLGIIAFLLVAFTDAIDGSIARTRDQITKFGMMFDPFADKLLVGSMVIILVFQNYHYALGLTIIIIELAFVIAALIARLKFNTVRMANIWGKIKMILQTIAIGITMLALLFNAPQFLIIGAWIFGIAIGFAILSLFMHGM